MERERARSVHASGHSGRFYSRQSQAWRRGGASQSRASETLHRISVRQIHSLTREVNVSKIVPCLWYSDKAEEAAKFYASILPNSRVDSVTALPAESPSGPAGSIKVVEFTLLGQPRMAMAAGPLEEFNRSVAVLVEWEDEAEIDRLWDALSAGGKIEQCGWL